MSCVKVGSHSFACQPVVYPYMERAVVPLLSSRRVSIAALRTVGYSFYTSLFRHQDSDTTQEVIRS